MKENQLARTLRTFGLTTPRPPAPQGAAARPSLEGSTQEQYAGLSLQSALKRRSLGNPKCQRGVVRGVSSDGGHVIIVPVLCGKWDCPYCGPRRLRLVRRGIKSECLRLGLDKMMTLTLPSRYSGDGFSQLYAAWTLFCKRYRRRFSKSQFHFIACVELQPGRKAPHLHVIIRDFIPQRWLSACWASCGGGRIVDIRRRDASHMAEYITDYVTKSFLGDYYPPGLRRFRTSRSVHLFVRKKVEGYKWTWLNYDIQHAWDNFFLDGKCNLRPGGGFEIFLYRKKSLDSSGPNVPVFQYLPYTVEISEPEVKKNAR